MSNPFKNTEPDFSKDEEFRLNPDFEPYLGRIGAARMKGDHKMELLQAQKLLFLYRRRGDAVFIGALSRCARAWESLNRDDIAVAYLEEAFNQIGEVHRHQESKVALKDEIQRLQTKLETVEKYRVSQEVRRSYQFVG